MDQFLKSSYKTTNYMKTSISILLGLLSFIGAAQHTISGTFSPAEDYKWLIAYRLKPGSQNYVADAPVKDGILSLSLPENALPGTYRLVYAIPQEEYYFDIIYNGKDNIELTYNDTDGVTFIASQENILLNSYFKKVNALEQQIVQFYTSQKTNKKEFIALAKELKTTQEYFTEKSQGLICHNFIKANASYIPSKYVPIQEYVKQRKENYFTALDFKNTTLQSSGFLTDKVLNYVMTALPLDPLSPSETEVEMQKNVSVVNTQLEGISTAYKTSLFYNLWKRTSGNGFNATSDFIYDSYLKALAKESNLPEISAEIEQYGRLRLGAVAPEIVWKTKTSLKKLSELEGANHYILVFWSSTCSHCLHELPKLHKSLSPKKDIKVVAIGMEDDTVSWERESAKFPSFEHAISLGKWQSEYASLYAIQQTPTYFVLDKDKKIIGKPEDYEKTIEFLENLK